MARKVARLTTFKSDHQLVVRKDVNRNILLYGKDNKYPGYLLKLYKEQPTHGSIVNGKAMYLAGLGLKPKSENPQAQAWLDRANPSESWYDISLKINKDKPLYGAFAIRVVPNVIGVPLWYFHMDWGKLRISDCGTEVKHSDNWDDRNCQVDTYPIWYPGCKECSVYIFRTYNPSVKKIEAEYPATEYEAAIMDIDTEVRVSNFFNSLVINGFSAATVITIYGGKPETQQEEDEVVNSIMGRHEGDEKAGRTAIIWADKKDDGGADIQTVDATDLDKQFQEVSKRNAKNIYAAHAAPAELFAYISDVSTVFDVTHIVEQSELFMNSYVIPKQKEELKMISLFYELRTGQKEEFIKEQFEPIGLDLPLEKQPVVDALNGRDPNIILNYLDKKYKLNLPKTDSPNGQIVAPVQQVNDHLKNLTAQQSMAIDRVVRKYKKGTYSEAQATILLKSYGLTDEEIKQFLEIVPTAVPIQQRIQMSRSEKFFELFDKYAHDIQDDELLETKFIGMEQLRSYSFAGEDEIRNSVLNQVKGNPDASEEKIAGILGVSKAVVVSALAWLLTKGLIEKTGSNLFPTVKGINKDAQVTEVYTEYTYGKRPDVEGPAIIPTTRDFCRQMLSRHGYGKKALTFEAIDSMTNEFGEDVWSYRGGWYGNEPWCRHVWIAQTKVRRK